MRSSTFALLVLCLAACKRPPKPGSMDASVAGDAALPAPEKTTVRMEKTVRVGGVDERWTLRWRGEVKPARYDEDPEPYELAEQGKLELARRIPSAKEEVFDLGEHLDDAPLVRRVLPSKRELAKQRDSGADDTHAPFDPVVFADYIMMARRPSSRFGSPCPPVVRASP